MRLQFCIYILKYLALGFMSRNDQQGTNKRRSKSVEGSSPKNTVKAERVPDDSANKPEKSNPEPKTKLKAKKSKQKEVSETIKSEVNEAKTNKSDPDSYRMCVNLSCLKE
jgi:hypothetical protein